MSALRNLPELRYPFDGYKDEQLDAMVATYLWFEYFGRRLTREEFREIVGAKILRDKEWRLKRLDHDLLDRLENPSDELTMAYEILGFELKQTWIRRVGRWFAELRQEERVTRARAQDLMGFTGRAPRIIRSFQEKYTVGSKRNLEGFECLTHYGLINWAKNDKGETLSSEDTRQIFSHHYDTAFYRHIQSSEDLANHELKNTQEIKLLAELHSQFVEIAAAEMVRRYEVEYWKLESRPFRDIVPQRNPAPASTSNLAASTTTGATASSSRQPIVPGLSQHNAATLEFSDLISNFLLVKLSPDDMPMTWNGKRMPILTFGLIYATYHWISPNGRPITFEEIQDILCFLYGEKDPARIAGSKHYDDLLDKLDTNAEKTSVVLDFCEDREKNILKDGAQLLFDYLLEDPAAKLRDKNLQGFSWRLPCLPWWRSTWGRLKRLEFEGHILLDHQMYFISWLVNECRDYKGKPISEADAITVIADHYGYAITRHDRCDAYRRLGNDGDRYGNMVDTFIQDPATTHHFGIMARSAHESCSRRGMLRYRAALLSDSNSESELDPATTSGMAAMTVGATASDPRRNPQPAPSGSSTKQPGGKGKGRARDSSSGTPPEGHLGGPEGKKPQRKTPRQR